MAWFSVPVVFAIEAPTDGAAVLLAEQQHADELGLQLDYPEVAVAGLGQVAQPDQVVPAGFARFLVAVTLTVESDSGAAARAEVHAAVAELEASAKDLVEVRAASATQDPRLLSEASKQSLADARDWITDHLRMDAAALRAGQAFDELTVVHDALPWCFAQDYTPELVEQFLQAVERVTDKLASYPDTYLASTAEELAAHALLAEARSALAMRQEMRELSAEEAAAAERQIDELHELAFEDYDVLLLFDARFDGIEAGEIAEQMGMVNLHVRDWFKPFRSG